MLSCLVKLTSHWGHLTLIPSWADLWCRLMFAGFVYHAPHAGHCVQGPPSGSSSGGAWRSCAWRSCSARRPCSARQYGSSTTWNSSSRRLMATRRSRGFLSGVTCSAAAWWWCSPAACRRWHPAVRWTGGGPDQSSPACEVEVSSHLGCPDPLEVEGCSFALLWSSLPLWSAILWNINDTPV